MNAGLRCKGGRADIGRLAVRRPVQHFIEGVGDLRQVSARPSGVTPVSNRSAYSRLFSISVGMRLTRLALPQRSPMPVQRALHLSGTGANGGERIGDRLTGVVVGMDADSRSPGMMLTSSPRRSSRPRAAASRRWCRRGRPSVLRHRALSRAQVFA